MMLRAVIRRASSRGSSASGLGKSLQSSRVAASAQSFHSVSAAEGVQIAQAVTKAQPYKDGSGLFHLIVAFLTHFLVYVIEGEVVEAVVPHMGESITHGTLAIFLKKPGDRVEADEAIAQIETDKAKIDIASPASGVIQEFLVKEGDTIEPGNKIAIISKSADAVSHVAPSEKIPEKPSHRPFPPAQKPKVETTKVAEKTKASSPTPPPKQPDKEPQLPPKDRERRIPSEPSFLGSVVKIFTIIRTTDTLHPWRHSTVEESGGSGFVISGRRVLTNAHVVSGATLVEIKKLGSGTKYKAHVQSFGHDCDLALLTVDIDDFWEGLEPLDLLDNMPKLSQTVQVVGYPTGGESISMTSGIVSRIDTKIYTHSKGACQLPAFQVDAAINPGNSGGPAMIGKSVIGVAFERFIDGDNIGYVIPSQIVKLFLTSVNKNLGNGFCSLGLSMQPMENSMMRDYFKMTENMTGVIVIEISEISPVRKSLKLNDVLLEVDGIPIQNDGEGINLDGFISLKKPGDLVRFKVLRKGKVIKLRMKMLPIKEAMDTKDYPSPSYYIFAGIVFTNSDAGGNVKISQVLEGDINKGYTGLVDLEVEKVNGVDVFTVEDLSYELENCSTKEVRFDIEGKQIIILKMKSVKEASRQLLNFHKVMWSMSEDIREMMEEEENLD